MKTAIYHITTKDAWRSAQTSGSYTAPSLRSEGFIHCSTAEQVITVANAFYHTQTDLVLLRISVAQLTSRLEWEAPAHPGIGASALDERLFPHIYGALNLDAVVRVFDLAPDQNGFFQLPDINQ